MPKYILHKKGYRCNPLRKFETQISYFLNKKASFKRCLIIIVPFKNLGF